MNALKIRGRLGVALLVGVSVLIAGSVGARAATADTARSCLAGGQSVTVADQFSMAAAARAEVQLQSSQTSPSSGCTAKIEGRDLTITVNWGDGTIERNVHPGVSHPNGKYSWNQLVLHHYATRGEFKMTATIAGYGEAATIPSKNIAVQAMAFNSDGGVNPSLNGCLRVSKPRIGAEMSVGLDDSVPGADINPPSVVIAWGDGKTTTARMHPVWNGFAFSQEHVYPHEGGLHVLSFTFTEPQTGQTITTKYRFLLAA
jgi:hypothetical protein